MDAVGRAAFALLEGRPSEVTVRVLESGVVVTESTVEPEFVRVGGTAECGGPTEAEVVVPAP